MAGTLTPTPFQTVLDATGVAVSGAKIYTYTAGTTTAAATYTTLALDVENANPIVADSSGRYVAYLPAGGNFKFTFKTSGDVLIKEQDNIQAVPGSSVNLDITGTVGEAVTAGEVVYLSSGTESSPLTAGLWYLTDSDATATSTLPQSVGMAISAIAINTAGTIRLAGEATTDGAVVVGSTYYVGATPGAIVSSAPSNSRVVGVANTTSTLILSATTAVVASIPDPITQDLLFTDDTYDIGKSGATRPRDGFFSRNIVVGGTMGVTGIATLTAQPILSSLTASQATFTDGSKGLVSNAITGTGNVVMSASPTLTGTIGAAALTLSGSLSVGGATTLTGGLNTPLVVAQGGTGLDTLTANGILLGAGTSDVTLLAPSTSGNIATSNGTVWQSTAPAAGGFSPLNLVEGRLTLTSATPVTTADVTGATTLYWALYKGNRIALYTGSEWSMETVAELSISVPSTTVTMYDAFIDYNGGTPALAVTAWTNDTTRATALAVQNGVLVQTGNLDWRYVGSFRTTGVSGQTEDSKVKRYLWNYYHRIPRTLYRHDNTNSWTYTTGTIRQANGSTANQVEAVIGVAEAQLSLKLLGISRNGTLNVNRRIGIGVGTTTAFTATDVVSGPDVSSLPANVQNRQMVFLNSYPPIGWQYYSWNEWSTASGSCIWWGDDGDPGYKEAGLSGEVEG
jgi:hypothetical protein